MDNNITLYKTEVEKINQRIKEYLWKAKYWSTFKRIKSKNSRAWFLDKLYQGRKNHKREKSIRRINKLI